jgi:hypothetical protein
VQVLVEVPYLLAQAVLFSVISYWMVQFEASPGKRPLLGIGSDFYSFTPDQMSPDRASLKCLGRTEGLWHKAHMPAYLEAFCHVRR